MKEIVTGQDELVANWIFQRTGGTWSGDGKTIGLWDTNKNCLVAGVLYDSFNGANINISIAGEGKEWLNREFLWFGFYYPFEQLNVRRMTGLVACDNKDSINWCERCGFVLEATLEKAHPSGDLYVYRLLKEDCKWLNLKGKKHGQQIRRT